MRAIVSDGISETAVFKNDGYSEIYHFDYTARCDAPRFALGMSQGTTSEKITWQAGPGHTGYRVQFRKTAPADKGKKKHKKRGGKGAKKGKSSGSRIWFESDATEPETVLRFLEPATQYEFRVGGRCLEGGGYSYSTVSTFTTPSREEAASEYNCGIPPEILITNKKPLKNLDPGEKFTAGDFPVTVVEATGGGGTFSGRGHIVVPYLGLIKIAVRFDNIEINNDRQMTVGTVETQYDADFATGTNAGSLDVSPLTDPLVATVNDLYSEKEQLLQQIAATDDPGEKKDLVDRYNEIDVTVDATIDEIDNVEDLPEELRQELADIKKNGKIASNDNLSPSDVEGIRKADAADRKRVAEIAAVAEDIKFVNLAYEMAATDPVFGKFFEDLKKIVEHLQDRRETCKEEGWRSKDGKGIVPHCLWRDIPVPVANHHSELDVPFVSGIVDGAYQEGEGLVMLPGMLADLSTAVNDIAFAYVSAYAVCTPELTRLNGERMGRLLEKLEEGKNETGIWSWAKEKWYSAQGYAATTLKTKCDDAEKLRNEVDEMAAYLSKVENIRNLALAIKDNIVSYLGSLAGQTNDHRYEHGRLAVQVGTIFISGLGALTKSVKAKKVLEAMRRFTKAEWEKYFQKFDERLGKGINNAGGELIGSARQFVRNNYGQDFLNQITKIYGKENTGALSVIVKRFGDEGADLLKKGKSLDEIANALVKDRVLYRHIGSKAGYLDNLKKTGEIPSGYTTYFSADKFDDPLEAISQMQLNSEWTDAVWVAEFDGAQLIGKVQIPKAKWNEANYLEVLTKSFPKWGDGGASQFITKSNIKVSKLRNLDTGEIINFN